MQALAIDRRVARTRTALYDSLVSLIREKPYDEISVEEILGRANVGRSTFYAHFTSKDDLLERSLERLYALLMEALADGRRAADQGAPARDPCRTLFEHVAEYQDVGLALASGRGGVLLREAIDAVLARALANTVPANVSGLPRDLIIRHLIGTFHTVLGWWFTTQPDMTPAAADALFRRLVLDALPRDVCGNFLGETGRPG